MEEGFDEDGNRIVKIIVSGGCVVDVINLPQTCLYEIIDEDIMKDEEEEIERIHLEMTDLATKRIELENKQAGIFKCSNCSDDFPEEEEVLEPKNTQVTFCSEECRKEYLESNSNKIPLTKFARKCNDCGKVFNEGYCVGQGEEYYCSEECLHKHISKEEWAELYDEGKGDSYWTSWEDEEEYLYYEDGTEVEG